MGDVRVTLVNTWPTLFEGHVSRSLQWWRANRDKITDQGWLTVYSSWTVAQMGQCDGPGWMALENATIPDGALLVFFEGGE